jgi:hypothetical protein
VQCYPQCIHIFSEVCSHAIQLVTHEELEEAIYKIPVTLNTVQQKKLKTYYKQPLPIQHADKHAKANLDLHFLPAVNGIPTKPLKELRELLESEKGMNSRQFCALVGPSGCKKTWTVFQLTDGPSMCEL